MLKTKEFRPLGIHLEALKGASDQYDLEPQSWFPCSGEGSCKAEEHPTALPAARRPTALPAPSIQLLFRSIAFKRRDVQHASDNHAALLCTWRGGYEKIDHVYF